MKCLAAGIAISILLTGVGACSSEFAESAEADGRVDVADARIQARGSDAPAARVEAPVAKYAGRKSKGKIAIPAGTTLSVSMVDTLDSEKSSAGDHFLASLGESVVVHGVIVLPKGTKVRGLVLEVQNAGRVKGRASIRLAITDIFQGDRKVPIDSDIFSATADSGETRDARIGEGADVVLSNRGHGIHYGPETLLNFTVRNSVEL
jgi:hypothetical protein